MFFTVRHIHPSLTFVDKATSLLLKCSTNRGFTHKYEVRLIMPADYTSIWCLDTQHDEPMHDDSHHINAQHIGRITVYNNTECL